MINWNESTSQPFSEPNTNQALDLPAQENLKNMDQISSDIIVSSIVAPPAILLQVNSTNPLLELGWFIVIEKEK